MNSIPEPWNYILMIASAIASFYTGLRLERYRLKRLQFTIEIDRRNSGRPKDEP